MPVSVTAPVSPHNRIGRPRGFRCGRTVRRSPPHGTELDAHRRRPGSTYTGSRDRHDRPPARGSWEADLRRVPAGLWSGAHRPGGEAGSARRHRYPARPTATAANVSERSMRIVLQSRYTTNAGKGVRFTTETAPEHAPRSVCGPSVTSSIESSGGISWTRFRGTRTCTAGLRRLPVCRAVAHQPGE
jgi:hypothetical protein